MGFTVVPLGLGPVGVVDEGWAAMPRTAGRPILGNLYPISGARGQPVRRAGGDNHRVANFCQKSYPWDMSTMNISLPDVMKSFVDEQVSSRGYGTSSEYVRDLIRKDQDRQNLRVLLLEGANSEPGPPADKAQFESLHARVGKARKA
tara:strand:- start:837 stop:1277 length:441 start_codon:yes stop_codon:yes gene_type:complete